MLECSIHDKEVQPGMSMTYQAKLKTPFREENARFVLSLCDEYGREFGDELPINVKMIDVGILDANNFEEPEVPKHEAELKFADALTTIKEMGIEINDNIKNLVVKFKGNINEIFDNLNL
mmetsp:Transcript_24993/g.28680  ORF Transcript_24993/g.28680 Transcript_24993/m.28680 type:complete len:120 (-) Transcript_24993:35-394(-)